MSDTRKQPKTRDALLKLLSDMNIRKIDPPKVKRNPTGILSLDLALKGGLPKGKMMLWYGAKGQGKSTTAYLLIREQLRNQNRCLLLDVERSFDIDYAYLLGFTDEDLQYLDIIIPETAEQGWDAIIAALETKAYSLIVIDTLAKMVPSTELGASVSKQHMALQPRLNAQATRIWGNALAESGSTVLFLNQQRSNLSLYGAPNLNPGGQAIEHEAAITIYMGKNENQYADGKPTSLVFRYRFEKSKLFEFEPGLYYQINIACADGIYELDYPFELFTAAKAYHILEDKDGGVWQKNVAYYKGEKLGNGEAQVLEWFSQPSVVRDDIEQAVLARISDTGEQRLDGTAAERETDRSEPLPESLGLEGTA